jgi:hypothetical protein
MIAQVQGGLQQFPDLRPIQRWVFCSAIDPPSKDVKWNPGEIIRISFTDPPSPLWTFLQAADTITLSTEEQDRDKLIQGLSPMDAIRTVIEKELQPLIGVKLVFVESGGDIRIQFDPLTPSRSALGTQCRDLPASQATMNFQRLNIASILHQFGHALGMVHEQTTKPSTEWSVDILRSYYDAIGQPNANIDNIVMFLSQAQSNTGTYSAQSIMQLYYPIEFTSDGVVVYPNPKLSSADLSWLTSTYPRRPSVDFKNYITSTDRSGHLWIKIGLGGLGIVVVSAIVWWWIIRARSSASLPKVRKTPKSRSALPVPKKRRT